jgi:hypothetical protein
MKHSDTLDNRRTPASSSRREMEAKLTMDQTATLRQLESFGWTLRFVRQPLFQDPIPVVVQGKGNVIGILEHDGRLKVDINIQIRDEEKAQLNKSRSG